MRSPFPGMDSYDTIDYRQPVQPPLDPANLAWAKEWLRAKGMR